MRNLISLALKIIAVVVLVKLGMWLYEGYQADKPRKPTQNVLDIDRDCRIIAADTGQCVCRHRHSNEVLATPYDKCVALARSNQN